MKENEEMMQSSNQVSVWGYSSSTVLGNFYVLYRSYWQDSCRLLNEKQSNFDQAGAVICTSILVKFNKAMISFTPHCYKFCTFPDVHKCSKAP